MALEEKESRFNGLKWLLAMVVLVAAIASNYYYAHVAWALRAAVGIVVVAVVLAIVSLTAQGQSAWVFFRGARNELRKVVWPTRQETIQMTMIVVVMVLITAVALWGFDGFFRWAIGLLSGQRG